jgi:D-alanyl-D-alanine carboxypeptidase
MPCRVVLALALSLHALAPASADRVDDYVRAEMRKEHVPGVSVAVVRGDKVVVARGYGLANVELAAPATKETVYELLSITKQFTAAAILMLVQEGKLSLDERISRYLPDVPAAWSEITVRHLLTHTSGIPDYTDVRGWFETIRQDRTPEDLLKPVREEPLQFTPGTQWRYSNAGYYLLGMILEKVSGRTWAQFLSERIFQPLGMAATRANDLIDVIPHRASGYTWQNDRLQNALYVSPTHKWAAGAVVSSVADLARWDAALSSAKLLPRPVLGQSWTPAKLASGVEAPYGFGNELSRDHGHRVAGHQGGGMAFNATMLRFVDDRLTIIVLCNLTQAPSRAMARHIAQFYLPDLSDARNRGIPDPDPKTTALLKGVLLDARQGKADAALFAPEAQATVPFIQRAGPSFLGSLGTLRSFVLLERREEPKKRVLRYRAIFGNTSLLWTFELTPEGKITSLSPTPE